MPSTGKPVEVAADGTAKYPGVLFLVECTAGTCRLVVFCGYSLEDMAPVFDRSTLWDVSVFHVCGGIGGKRIK